MATREAAQVEAGRHIAAHAEAIRLWRKWATEQHIEPNRPTQVALDAFADAMVKSQQWIPLLGDGHYVLAALALHGYVAA
jgi:hypothetical protein